MTPAEDNPPMLAVIETTIGPLYLRTIMPAGQRVAQVIVGPQIGGAVALTLDEAVELARVLVRAAATNGWGSDTERQRLIAWAPIGKHDG